jgi:hypothetical protein
MAELLAGAIDRWRRGVAPPAVRTDVVARYERRVQTGQLAELIERVAGAAASWRAPETAPTIYP